MGELFIAISMEVQLQMNSRAFILKDCGNWTCCFLSRQCVHGWAGSRKPWETRNIGPHSFYDGEIFGLHRGANFHGAFPYAQVDQHAPGDVTLCSSCL